MCEEGYYGLAVSMISGIFEVFQIPSGLFVVASYPNRSPFSNVFLNYNVYLKTLSPFCSPRLKVMFQI